MKSILFTIFLFAFFFQNNCSDVAPQSTAPVEDVQTELVAVKKNAKYQFTAYIYRKFTLVTDKKYKDDKGKYLILENNRTGKKSAPIDFKILSYPDSFEDLWSPNEEFLAFPSEINGRRKIGVYKAADLENLIDEQGKFQSAGYIDFVDFYRLGKQTADVRRIREWTGDAAFSFSVRVYESKDGAPPFVYDIAGKKFAADESFKLSFEAENKNGKITVGKAVK